MTRAEFDRLPPVVTVEEAAGLLRISRTTAYEACRTGDLPSIRVGRTVRIPRHRLAGMLGYHDNHDVQALGAEEKR